MTLRASLKDLPVPAVRFFDSTGSTNQDALAWAELGAPDGSLVVADEQTAGRGRLNRQWVTSKGAALAFSLILRPTPEEAIKLGLFSPLAALAVRDALVEEYSLPAQVKWPNDVLVNGRKISGILAEASWQGDRLSGMVIGVGVNVLRQAVPPANQLLFPATSVEDGLGRTVEREELLAVIMQRIFAWRFHLGKEDFLAAWENCLAYRGEEVRIDVPGNKVLEGTVLGIDSQGNLRLKIKSGGELAVLAGDVHLRPAA